jgi:hypothetical protein
MGDRAKFPGRYQQVQLLGEGNFAKVYLARHMYTKQEVAIKVMDKEKLIKLGAVHQIKREIAVMRRLGAIVVPLIERHGVVIATVPVSSTMCSTAGWPGVVILMWKRDSIASAPFAIIARVGSTSTVPV